MFSDSLFSFIVNSGPFLSVTVSFVIVHFSIFGFDGIGDASAISEHVKNIRAKFQKYGKNPIETVWGIGYRWKG